MRLSSKSARLHSLGGAPRDREEKLQAGSDIPCRYTKLVANGWYFANALVKSPRSIGAIAPSSTALADAMSHEVPKGDDFVVELGGGTGSITSGLLRAGVSGERIVVVERDKSLCARITERFPIVRVVCGDARNIKRLLPKAGVISPACAVVSGLPLLTMSVAERFRVLLNAWSITDGQGPFVQFSYGMICPVPASSLARLGATATRSAWIARNLPPASVWRIERGIR